MTTLAKQLSDLVGKRVSVQSSTDALSRDSIVAVLTRREGTNAGFYCEDMHLLKGQVDFVRLDNASRNYGFGTPIENTPTIGLNPNYFELNRHLAASQNGP